MLVASLLAQAAAAASPPAAAAPPQGVISYPPAFFAGQQVANAAEMLARVPGFSLDAGDTVRGFEGAAGNVVIDGRRPASKTDNLEEILRRIPTGQVERIDLIRGGAPGIDMQGKSVIANVIRKSAGGFHGLLAVANNHVWDGRNMHAIRVELSGGDGARTWEATARYGYSADDGGDDGPQLRLAPDGAILRRSIVNKEADGLQQTLTAAYGQPLFGGRVALNGRAFWDSWKEEETNRYTDPAGPGVAAAVDPYDVFETEIGGRFDRDFGSRTKLELIGLRKDKDHKGFSLFQDQGGVADFRSDRDISETIGRAALKHQRSTQLSFEAGGEAALNRLDSRTRFAFNGAAQVIPAANVQIEEARGELFAKSTWRPSAAWTLEASLRYEASRIESRGDVVLRKSLGFLKPRVAVSWAATPATQLRLSGERSVGQLNFDDFVASPGFNLGQGVSAGNPDLDPEQAWVAEATIEQRLWKSGAVTLTYRHSELSDAVDRGPARLERVDPATGQTVVRIFDQPTNIGDGTKDELSAAFTLPFEQFGWKGALLRGELERRWSKVTDPTTLTTRPISKLRPLEWEVHFSQDLPQRGAAFGFDLYGGWSETSYRFDYVSEVKLHNAYLATWIEKRLQPNTALRLELANWTQRGIRFTERRYAGPRDAGALDYTDDRDLKPGRSFFVRVRHTFGG